MSLEAQMALTVRYKELNVESAYPNASTKLTDYGTSKSLKVTTIRPLLSR